jgi:peptidoglycan/LPS O-acetylase OafA/YrhL
MILLMVFVAGPLTSTLGIRGYFESGWYTVYLKNLRFFIIYALPGVFENLPVANAVNGSLWTMPVEAALYVLTPLLLLVLGVCGGRGKGRAQTVNRYTRPGCMAMAAATVVVCAFDLYLRVFHPTASLVFYGTDLVAAYHLIVLYVIGMLFTYEEVRTYLNLQVASVLLLVLLLFQFSSEGLQYLMLYLIFPYFIFSLAFAPGAVFRNICRRVEPSYGIYLYGFFFQQLVVLYQQQHGISWGYLRTLLIAAVPTVVAAVLSYYLIERPAMRLGKRLISKLRK